MRLDEFPDRTKVCRDTWKKGLYLIKSVQGEWRYMENGNVAGSPSSEMLDRDDFIYYEKEKVMANVNFVGGEYNVVAVRHIQGNSFNGGIYNYKIAADIPVEENYLVVVHSSNGLGLARVIKAYANTFENAEEVGRATAWVVNVVDEQDHANRIKATEKRKYIIQQLEERKAALEATQVYEMLGKVDPVAKKLLKQLSKIS